MLPENYFYVTHKGYIISFDQGLPLAFSWRKMRIDFEAKEWKVKVKWGQYHMFYVQTSPVSSWTILFFYINSNEAV